MGSNHMNEQFRQAGGKNRNGKVKVEIPTHDPQTGEANPYYEELTGEKLPSNKVVVLPETDLEKFNRHLISIANNDVGIRHKILMVEKFIEALGRKED